MAETAQDLQKIYQRRFSETAAYRNLAWRELARVFFNRWVGSDDAVLDLGCGEGRLLELLLKERQFTQILGMDVSYRALEVAQDRLRLERLPSLQRERIELIQSALSKIAIQ